MLYGPPEMDAQMTTHGQMTRRGQSWHERLSARVNQLFYGAKPVFFRRSVRATSCLPHIVREFGDFAMSEWLNAVPIHRHLSLPVSGLRMLKSLPGMLMPGFMFLFPVLLGRTVGMGG
jgi:hypothetical protein